MLSRLSRYGLLVQLQTRRNASFIVVHNLSERN